MDHTRRHCLLVRPPMTLAEWGSSSYRSCCHLAAQTPAIRRSEPPSGNRTHRDPQSDHPPVRHDHLPSPAAPPRRCNRQHPVKRGGHRCHANAPFPAIRQLYAVAVFGIGEGAQRVPPPSFVPAPPTYSRGDIRIASARKFALSHEWVGHGHHKRKIVPDPHWRTSVPHIPIF